jgi:chromosome segregation ATPase
MTFAASAKPSIVGALVLTVLTLAACGESEAEKAKAEICSARNEISKQISKLQSLTFSTSAIDEAKTSFETITKELTKIKDAEPKLEASRREQLEPSVKTFESQISSIAKGVASSLTSGNLETALKTAEPKLRAAVSTLAGDFKQAFGPISCS